MENRCLGRKWFVSWATRFVTNVSVPSCGVAETTLDFFSPADMVFLSFILISTSPLDAMYHTICKKFTAREIFAAVFTFACTVAVIIVLIPEPYSKRLYLIVNETCIFFLVGSLVFFTIAALLLLAEFLFRQ